MSTSVFKRVLRNTFGAYYQFLNKYLWTGNDMKIILLVFVGTEANVRPKLKP